MENLWTWFILLALAIDFSVANPTLKDLKTKTKKGGSPGGFYSLKFGSVYDAKDFAEEPTTAAPLREAQEPTGVAGPHQQNIDEEIKSEVPNVEEHTTLSPPTISEDLTLGVKGGIKGVKNVPRIRLEPEPPVDKPIKISIIPNGAPTVRSDILDVTRPPLVSDNLTKKKGKGIKGGSKGYNYDANNIRNLFTEDKATEHPLEVTTVESYNPSIINLPTERTVEEVTVVTTENYRQETVAPVQQTELPVQQTEEPIQQTEPPVQQTELPVQQTELPVQQTELPVQQTEEPIRETEPTTQRHVPTTLPPVTTEPYEPVQDTQSPIEPQVTEKPEYPPQTTVPPTTTEYQNEQQTEIPQVTQVPEEPYQVTEVPTTQVPKTSDEFSKYPLGVEGSLHIRGGGIGKGKGGKGSKGGKGWKKELNVKPSVAVLSRGSSGVSSRRGMNPATPLLPSLRGYQG